MLKLYIDGHPVNISKGTRTDYYEKNPFFTNEGDYTLDIDINLNDLRTRSSTTTSTAWTE